MTLSKLSKKQKAILKWCHMSSTKDKYKTIICDGAVRSGKTVAMVEGFILWAMKNFNNCKFGICGKTVRSTERNIIMVIQDMTDLTSIFKVDYISSTNLLTIKWGNITNYFHVFGGKDESSYKLVQGITLSGVLFDEVALMPQSFVNQTIARTLSVSKAKLWFNCNPDNPNHWFNQDWIIPADNGGKANVLHLHFLMSDNPILTQEDLDNAESMYTGVFKDRYILGKWKATDGLIYQQFADNPTNWVKDFSIEEKRKHFLDADFISIGVDLGGNRSLTTFVATVVHRNFTKLTVVKDYHIAGKKGDIDSDRVNKEFISFVEQLQTEYPNIFIRYCYADSEAQYLINGMVKACHQYGLTVQIGDSAKNEIVQRIICTNTLLNTNRLVILKGCNLVKGGLENAAWDTTKADDTRMDNFSSDIDILDAFEYSFERFMTKLTPNRR